MRLLVLLLLLAAMSGCFGEEDDSAPGGDDGDDTDDDTDDDGTDDSTDDGDDGTDEGNETEDEPVEPRDPVTWDISISGTAFVDGSITIQAGDTVEWTHQDGATPHTVTSDDGEFHSGDCPGADCMTEFSGAEFRHTFDDEGEFPYHCQVHSSMTGTITVLAVYNETPEA